MKTSVTKLCEVLVIGAYLSIGACGLFFPGAGVVLGPPNIAAEDPENITPTTSYTRAGVRHLGKEQSQMLLAGAVEGAEQPQGQLETLYASDPTVSSTYCEFSYDKKPFFCGLGYGAASPTPLHNDISNGLAVSKDGRVVGGWIRGNNTYAIPHVWAPHGADPAAKALTPPSAPPPSAFEADIPSSEKIKTLRHSFVFGLSPNGLRATGSTSYANDPTNKIQKQAFYWDYTEGIPAGLSSLANDTSPANFTLKRQSDFDPLTPTTAHCSYDSAGFAIADTDLADFRMLGGFATTNDRTAGYTNCANITFDPLDPSRVQFQLGALPFLGIYKSTTQLAPASLPAGYSYAEIIGITENSDRKIIGNALVGASLKYRGYFSNTAQSTLTLLPKNTSGEIPYDANDPDYTRVNAVTDNAEAIAGTLFTNSSGKNEAALWEWNGSTYSIKTLGIPNASSIPSSYFPTLGAAYTFANGVAKINNSPYQPITRVVGAMEIALPLGSPPHICQKVGRMKETSSLKLPAPTEAFIWDSRWVQNTDPVTGMKNLKTYLQEYLKQNNGFNSGLDAWTLCDATISSDGKTISGRGVLNEMFSSDPNYCKNSLALPESTPAEQTAKEEALKKCRHQAFIAHIPNIKGNGFVSISNSYSTDYHDELNQRKGTNPTATVTGDFNNDGNLDLVSANIGMENAGAKDGSLTIMYGENSGSFGNITHFQTNEESPYQLLSGDLDRDGNLDLAVVTGRTVNMQEDPEVPPPPPFSKLRMFLGTGNRAGTGPQTDPFLDAFYTDQHPRNAQDQYSLDLPTASRLEKTDFDGDGKLDFLATFNTQDLMIFFGVYDGNIFGLGRATTWTVLPSEYKFTGYKHVADIDKDGVPDLMALVSNSSANQNALAFFRGFRGSRFSFLPVSFTTLSNGNRPGSFVAGDFDNDGISDIAVSSENYQIQMFRGAQVSAEQLVFTPAESFSVLSPLRAAQLDSAADMNADGRPDLIVSSFFPGLVNVVLNQSVPGSFSLTAPYSPTNLGTPSLVGGPLAVGDFNKDGILDLAVPNYATHKIALIHGSN